MKDGRLFCESFSDAGLQHSRTLVPMIRDMLAASNISPEEIDAFAVASGPGSFTGTRIGVAAVKGLAFAKSAPCAGISSLLAMAYNAVLWNGYVVPVMDARRDEFYAAVFKCSGSGSPERITPDYAVGAEKLKEILSTFEGPFLLVGDGAEICAEKPDMPEMTLAPASIRRQRAAGVCAAAFDFPPDGWLDAEILAPAYLRLSQAERERRQKQNDS